MSGGQVCLAGHDNKEVVSFVTLRCIALHCVRAGLQMQHATCNMQESPAFFAQHGMASRKAPKWSGCDCGHTGQSVRCTQPVLPCDVNAADCSGRASDSVRASGSGGLYWGYSEYSVLGVPQCGADLSKEDLLERAAHKLKKISRDDPMER